MKEIIAKFQMLDNYVKEYKMELKGKINQNSKLEINCNLGYGMQDVREEEDKFIGQSQIVYDIILLKENEELGKIHLSMEGLFSGDKIMGKEKFEEMVKFNGATTLSQISRAYILSNTALSNMPTITLPMINFIEYFNKNKIANKNNAEV